MFILTLTFWLLFQVPVNHGMDLVDIKEMTVKCTADKKYIANITCLSRPGKNNFLFTLNATLNPSFIPVDDIFMHIKLYRFYGRKREWKLFLIDMHEDFCSFMNGTAKTPVLTLLLPLLRKHSNLNQKCPISVNPSFVNVPFAKDFLPPFIPSGKWRVAVDLISHKMKVISFEIFVTIV